MKAGYILGILLILLSAGALVRASEQAETEYFAVFLEGKKVGHAIHTRIVADQKVTTTEKVSITLSRANIPVSIDMTETCIETTTGEPLAFETIQQLSAMTMGIAGKVDKQGKVEVTIKSMGSEQKSAFDWPTGAVMAEGLRLLTLKKGLKEGTQYTAKIFSPAMLQPLDIQISIERKQNIDLLSRVVALTEVTTKYNMPEAGEIISTSYVDDELCPQKVIIPIAGMQMEMVACAKEFALGKNDVLEVIDKLFLTTPQPLNDVRAVKSITYCLKPTADANNLPIPSTDNQKVQRQADGQIMVTVKPVTAPAGAKFPYKGTDPAILQATKPTRFVQSDRQEIIELARRAVGDTTDAAEAVRKIEDFVADYVKHRSLSVGYASAAEVAASRQGDCSEFAVLATALCRAIGIPAQVVTGVAYVDDWGGLQGFGGHAWTQAYIDGKWVCLDASFRKEGLGGYGPGHITLAVGNGDPEDFFNLVTTIGQFKIDKITVHK